MTCEERWDDHSCSLEDDREPHACYCGYVWPEPRPDNAREFYIMIFTSLIGLVFLMYLIAAR